MRSLAALSIFAFLVPASAQAQVGKLWEELKVKRQALPGFHQEFEVTQTYKTIGGDQSSKRQITLDVAANAWREKSDSGSGDFVRVFDGKDAFFMEEGGDEYVKLKRRTKDEEFIPTAYRFRDPDLQKGKEIDRHACGIPGVEHQCVLMEMPLKRWARLGQAGRTTSMLQGVLRVDFDLETGLLLAMRVVQSIDNQRSAYTQDEAYVLRRIAFGTAPNAALFKLPVELREVKELSRWRAEKIRKELGGKQAPELAATDIKGKPVSLAAFKGKTVLLDFWTTWCPPCREDAPALDKLYKKYADKDLMIVGVSVDEQREVVESFMKKYPHAFPVVLTTENEMPRPYQISVFPTYIVIDKNGTLEAVVEGDKGFGDLQRLLKKYGLESD